MIPIDQTKVGKGGNCFQACIASLLEMKLEDVPDFMNMGDDDFWQRRVNEWLGVRGLGMVTLRHHPDSVLPPGCYHLLSGFVKRDPVLLHAVVGYEGIAVHDPNPCREFLLNTTHAHIVVKLCG